MIHMSTHMGPGSAYDQYGMGMTQEDIDKVFADTDKFSLAAQAAKKKS